MTRFWRTLRARAHFAVEVVIGRWKLRRCDVVGRWSRVRTGRVIVENDGHIEIGARTRLSCDYGPIELRTEPGGRLTIGSRTAINYATSISASEHVTIGDNVSIGPYCIIADREEGASDTRPPAVPITIGDDAWIASRVVLLPGSHIGAGAVITAGSIVEGAIPDRVVAGGVPARVLRRIDQGDEGPVAQSTAGPVAEEAPPAAAPIGSAVLISDFTIDPLVAALERTTPSLDAELAPFGAVVASLLDPPVDHRDVAVVWTRPELVLSTFRDVLDGLPVEEAALVAEVDRFAAQVRSGLAGFACVIIPTWTVAPWQRGRGLLDGRPGGVSWSLATANRQLATALGDSPNVFVLDAARWISMVGERAYSERLHYLGKIPFDDRVFEIAAAEIVAAVQAVRGAARKLVVVDLDNTLWGGVVGDVGWEELRLGGHDSVGEAFAEFQRALLALRRRGVLLALASKNEEDVALDAIARHPAMVLRRDDFAAVRINWSDKAANIAALVADLNLGMQSVVFIDDNPHERARVAEQLPELLVPDWPEDPTQYVKALASLRCFDVAAVTAEDLGRSEQYAAEQQRTSLRTEVGSLDDWIRDLQMVVTVEPLGSANVTRAAQLLNKTNQMNLRTRRATPAEMTSWANAPSRATWCVSVADRLGDAGLTGILSVEVDGPTARLVDFVLSCRVMGRRIEETMVHIAGVMAQAMGADVLSAEYLPTAKNVPCLRFFEHGPMSVVAEHVYELALEAAQSAPDGIAVRLPAPSGAP